MRRRKSTLPRLSKGRRFHEKSRVWTKIFLKNRLLVLAKREQLPKTYQYFFASEKNENKLSALSPPFFRAGGQKRYIVALNSAKINIRRGFFPKTSLIGEKSFLDDIFQSKKNAQLAKIFVSRQPPRNKTPKKNSSSFSGQSPKTRDFVNFFSLFIACAVERRAYLVG